MKGKSKQTDQDRRDFIKKSTIVGAGVVAASTVSAEVLADTPLTSSESEMQKGYQVTPHVIDYYKSADI